MDKDKLAALGRSLAEHIQASLPDGSIYGFVIITPSKKSFATGVFDGQPMSKRVLAEFFRGIALDIDDTGAPFYSEQKK